MRYHVREAMWNGHFAQSHVRWLGVIPETGVTHLNDLPFNRSVSVSCMVNADPNVVVEFSNDLELSLDCIACKRRHRTVVFQLGRPWAICTPKEKCTGFCGRLVSVNYDDSANFITYVVAYVYLPFLDVKRGDESTGVPIWGRVFFVATCPKCRRKIDCSTQTNIVRPFSKRCECDFVLYTETEEMPRLVATSTGDQFAR